MKTLIVVPCYNESKRLKQEEFLAFVQDNPDVEFLFANDGSRDNTLEVLQVLCDRHPSLHLYDIQPNGGKAEAVRKGMLYGAEHLSPDYIAFWDADLATPLNEIPHMVEWADKGYDVVIETDAPGSQSAPQAYPTLSGPLFCYLRIHNAETPCLRYPMRSQDVPYTGGKGYLPRGFYHTMAFRC